VAAVILLLAAPAAGQERVTLFVVSEKTDTLGVYRGVVPDLALGKSIPVGREPHNLGISHDGRWVATSDRRSGEVSAIDTEALTGIARIKLGRQTRDVTLGPDGRLAWVTNSRFTDLPDPRVDTLDVAERTVVGTISVGQYPFHSPKRGRDGNSVPSGAGNAPRRQPHLPHRDDRGRSSAPCRGDPQGRAAPPRSRGPRRALPPGPPVAVASGPSPAPPFGYGAGTGVSRSAQGARAAPPHRHRPVGTGSERKRDVPTVAG
jgi:hypothetical protein